MKSPSEKENLRRKLLDHQIREIEDLITNLKFVKDHPEFTLDGFQTLNRIQTQLIVLIQSYGESYLNLLKDGYDVD